MNFIVEGVVSVTISFKQHLESSDLIVDYVWRGIPHSWLQNKQESFRRDWACDSFVANVRHCEFVLRVTALQT